MTQANRSSPMPVELGDATIDALAGGNITTKIRDAGEAWPSEAYEQLHIGTDDFIVARGNTGGAGWIEISKSPFTYDDEVVIRFVDKVAMPYRVSLLTSMSHRNAGQQIASFEVVSDDAESGLAPVPEPARTVILNASQTTTTITVNFDPNALPSQPYRIGQVVNIDGFVDTRLNVNSAAVASVVSPTQITLVGNDYTFASTSITTTLGNGAAFIERNDLLDRHRNGLSLVQGSATATTRRFYTRSQAGLAKPSGTLAASHNATMGTDVATAAATGYDVAAWLPPLEVLIDCSRNGAFVQDRAPNANAALTGRFRQTEVVPNPARSYFMQFRLRSVPSLTRPVAKIVSISKAGSTTANITTDVNHGLVSGQYCGFYGVRDQAAFANQTSGVIVTVTGLNTLTLTHGSSTTATSYGGYLFLAQGQQPVGGAIAQVAQSVSRTANVVTLIGNAAWAAPAVGGNIVELVGVRDAVSGADLGLDGSYEVTSISTTTMILTPVPGHAPTGGDIVSTNCGGGVIQRLAYRIHSAMVVDYDPMLTESAAKGSTDAGESAGTQSVSGTVAISGTPAVAQSGVWSLTGAGTPAAPTSLAINSAASTNGQLVITGTTGVQALFATNNGATAAFVKLYNKATAPTVGTDTPVMIIPIPAASGGVPGVAQIVPGFAGHRFPLGLGLAITGGQADSDTTAVLAGQVKVHLQRTT